MLTVKTRIGLSEIEGMGLFADEDIAAGAVTWRYVVGFDQLFPAEKIAALPEPARSELVNHTHVDAATGLHVLCLDNARFMNHADKPNTRGVHSPDAIEGYDIATRAISRGEELTCDYGAFVAIHERAAPHDDQLACGSRLNGNDSMSAAIASLANDAFARQKRRGVHPHRPALVSV